MTWHYERNGIRRDNVPEDGITDLIMLGEPTTGICYIDRRSSN